MTVKMNAIVQKLAGGWNDCCSGMVMNPGVKPTENISVALSAQRIANLEQDKVGRHAMATLATAGSQRPRMIWVRRI
jgi:hypothetical protein